MRLIALSTALICLVQCASKPANDGSVVEAMPTREYDRLVAKNTAHTDQYSGFHQTFQADLTMLTTEMRNASLRQRASFLQWNEKQLQLEREKSIQESNAYSKFFLRFFTPDKEYDDLSKGKSIWKVYLEYSGSRFEGKVAKLADKLPELMAIYPQMERFSTPYEITFNVPMTTIEQGDARVVLTSSLGKAEFRFPTGK